MQNRLEALSTKFNIERVEYIGVLKKISHKGSNAEKIKLNQEKILLNVDVILDAYEALSPLFYKLYLRPRMKNNIKTLSKKYE